MKTVIQVETIRYFGNGNGTPSPLNENQKYLETPKSNFPFLNLNIDVTPSESCSFKNLLNHLHKNGFPNGEKPEFIMDSEVLTMIAAGDSESSEIRVLRKSGIVFVWAHSDEDGKDLEQKKFETFFKHFFIGNNSGDSEDSEDVKALFQAKIPSENGKSVGILYSGIVDGVDGEFLEKLRGTHGHHQSFNVIRFATTTFDFWREKSCRFFWNSVFGNVPNLTIGTRTGTEKDDPKTREPLCYPETSIYKIEKLSIEEIPSLAEKFAKKPKSTFKLWSIVDGEKRLQDFLKFLKTTVIQEDEVFKMDNKEGWRIEKIQNVGEEIEYFDLINQLF